MTFEEYMAAVELGHQQLELGIHGIHEKTFPKDPKVPPPPTFNNDAGVISNMAWGKFEHLSIIESISGSIRSNHYHKTDSHFMTVLDGEMHYYWLESSRPNSPAEMIEIKPTLKMIEVKRGETVFTPPLVPHATYFPLATRIAALSRKKRTKEEHEADLVRVKILTSVTLAT